MGVSGSQKGKIGQVGPGSSHSGSKHAREDRKALVSPALSQWCAGGWGWGGGGGCPAGSGTRSWRGQGHWRGLELLRPGGVRPPAR